jgi:conjugative transfer region protein TrbK
MRALTIKGWGALAALLVLAAAVVASAVAVLGSPSARRPAERFDAALAADAARCNHLGEAADADPACREAWRRSRARFLGLPAAGGRP